MAKRRKQTQTDVVDINEDKRQRFLRIGQPRMNRALSTIRLIGNLSEAQYEWGEADVMHIRQTLLEAVTDVVERFESKLVKSRRAEFHFSPSSVPSDDDILGPVESEMPRTRART